VSIPLRSFVEVFRERAYSRDFGSIDLYSRIKIVNKHEILWNYGNVVIRHQAAHNLNGCPKWFFSDVSSYNVRFDVSNNSY